jgi:hypothetical protein
MRFFALLMISSISVSHTTRADCNPSSIARNCDFFRQLDANDVVEFADGFQLPACALESNPITVNMNEGERKLSARVKNLLNKFPPEKRNSEKFKLWPSLIFQPVSDLSEEDKKVLGPDGLRELSAIAEEENNYFNQLLSMKKSHAKFDMRGQTERRKKLFDEAKKAIEEQFLQGRDPGTLRGTEAAIYKRIDAVEIDESTVIPRELECHSPAAPGFKYDKNKIALPPELMFYPDQSILRAIIHEFGHSFDLCSLSAEKEGSKKWFGNRKSVAELTSTPFYNTIQCLQSQDGGNFGNPKKISAASAGPLCSEDYQQSYEAFSDWVSAETLQANPGLLKSQRSSGPKPLMKLSGRILNAQSNSETLFYALDHRCGEDEVHNLGHPLWEQRLNALWLNYSRLRPAGCESNNQPTCQWPTPQKNNNGHNTDQMKSAR